VAAALELEREGDERMDVAVCAYVREDNAHGSGPVGSSLEINVWGWRIKVAFRKR
jgi:hypothetical protein